MSTGIIIGIGVAGLLLGIILGKFIFKANVRQELEKARLLELNAQKEAENIIKDANREAEAGKKEKMMEAKEPFLKLKDEHRNEIKKRERSIEELEKKLKSKDQSLNSKLERTNRQELLNL